MADQEREENEQASENESADQDEAEELEADSGPEDVNNDVYDDEGNVLEQETEDAGNKKNTAAESKPDPQRIQTLRSQLASRIQELREKRKAPGTSVNGTKRSREAILEARTEKQRVSKEKKQLKRKREEEGEGEKDAEVSESEDEELRDNVSDDDGLSGVMYSQVVFKDGDKVTADMSDIRRKKTHKGPRDVLGQLKHIEAKKAKLETMDVEKREEVETKTKWSKALALAEGEKVRDDEKMLKKSLKKQTQQKKKSERLWKDRQETVATNIADKQKKREDNIAMKVERNKHKGKKAKIRAGFVGKRRKTSTKSTGSKSYGNNKRPKNA